MHTILMHKTVVRLQAEMRKYLQIYERIRYMKLDKLKIGQPAVIVRIDGEGALRRRLLDMGLTPGVRVVIRKTAPLGDPIEISLRGYELTLRLEEAGKIEIEEI